MNRNTVFNLILFVVLSVAVLGGWWLVDTYLIPKPAPPAAPTQAESKPAEKKPARETVLALTGGLPTLTDALREYPTAFRPPVEPTKPVDSSQQLIALGGRGSGYNLEVLLTTRGGGVQQVAVPAFDQASRLGTTARESGDPYDRTTGPYPLELVPGYYRTRPAGTVKHDGPRRVLEPGEVTDPAGLTEPSYTILHYDDQDAPRPSADLATRRWEVEGTPRAGTDELPGEVVFTTTLGAPHFVKIKKTFTLQKNEFHVRMKLEFTATADRPKGSPRFVYQVCGPRNMPIEGEWYTGTLRNAVVGCKTTNGSARRAIVDAAHVTTEHGSIGYTANSSEVPGEFTFAAVVNQFFAAAVAIDPDQPDDKRKGLWRRVRATREWGPQPLEGADTLKDKETFYADKPQLGDITVRAVATAFDPGPAPTEHAYWLYHGPTKVRLLNSLHLVDREQRHYSADRATVDDRYIAALGLNTMTDAPSPNWFGQAAEFVGWTGLVVWFTNLMHDILGWMHLLVGNWGVNILMLTVLVRLVLLLPSRRQQASMIKMQDKMAAMKPELAKLQEKYKADPQRLNQEKTKLMLAHGVNPLSSMGGCLLMFAQMPVFLGLYYCLQESIFFRLDQFLWIGNLAAPDMLFTWSESIPFVSAPDQLGHSWYLGPFFNILPVLAVALMYLNFKLSAPPPTDEQQEMQQKTMKFMMIFMGVFFYKMAAGLCLYFIVSTLWGITERRLLKRKKKAADEAELIAGGGSGPSVNGTGQPATPPPTGFFGRFKERLMEKLEEAQRQAESQGRQIVNNPKPPPKQPPGSPPQQGGGGKKKRKRK